MILESGLSVETADRDATSPGPDVLFLSAADRAWVDRTRDSLSTQDKIAQLFVLSCTDADPDGLTASLAFKPGGIHRFPGSDLDRAWALTRRVVDVQDVPIIISGDIEGGGTGFGFATPFPNQLGIAACDDLDLTRALAELVAIESRALGFDWSMTPVVDINTAFRSQVVGTRSYGSNIATIHDQARVYIETLQAHGLAATAKHWPGEGHDDRDQHLLTTVNAMTMDQWHASFGVLFRHMIDAGVLAVMSAHIALPAYIRQHVPDALRDAFCPASLSTLLNERLLRTDLGFRGLIVSDATVMAGLTSWMDRAQAAPAVIQNGCDVFLFSRNPQEDAGHILQGLRDGRLSEERLEQAVTRMLSLKARLGLNQRTPDDRLPTIATARDMLAGPAHLATADRAAAKSITLVKDRAPTLPIDPHRHHRVVTIATENRSFFAGAPVQDLAPLLDGLRHAGFAVRTYDPEAPPTPADTDLVLYLVGEESTPVHQASLDWEALHGGSRKAMLRFGCDIPTIMVSFGNPYLLYEAPDVATYINAYSRIAPAQRALLERLLGQAPFTGISPIDPFCGREQLRY